jgi:hypothetical protein
VRFPKFPVNSLFLSTICSFWAEFEDFEINFSKFPVLFPVISECMVFGLGKETFPYRNASAPVTIDGYVNNSG